MVALGQVGEKVDCQGHEEALGSQGNVHYLDCGDLTGVYMRTLLYIKERGREGGKGRRKTRGKVCNLRGKTKPST